MNSLKKCEDISKQLIAYLDRRANSADRNEVEAHLATCSACHERAEEFRKMFGMLDALPTVEPSLGFDARLHARIAEEPRSRWFGWLVPQPRLAFSMALLLALSLWIGDMPRVTNNGSESATAATEQQDFEAIKDLGVLENYDVLSKFDALSEVPAEPSPAEQQAQPVSDQNPDQQPAAQE